MTGKPSCPRCGSLLPLDALAGGSCPRCLLRLGSGGEFLDGTTELAGTTESESQGPGLPPEISGTADMIEEGVPRREPGTTGRGPEARERIGPYRILQVLGEGGMGVVYLAEQMEPIRRRVALKVIKQGLDTKRVVARFEAECQAVALMDHPNVAKVFDAGETPDGRPYFVMEYVPGVPITQHCDRHKLPTRERIDLLCQICEGVQHAHQKTIIHRDLKPSNILVSIQDGKAVPKIIDFGVAKATAHPLTERTLFTELGVLIGTPEYMSPEQADLTGQDVDTRTDVYSLGVMLYELLVGALPFEPKDLRQEGYDGIRRKIRDEDPAKPSTRLSRLGDERSTETAKRRGVDLRTLRRQLTGDLDWITMKALEKDRTRRYGSPSDLAADLRRHLKDEPVVARPPSAVYQFRKLARRRKGPLLATGFVAASLLFGLGTTTLMFVRARAAGRLALAERNAAQRNSYAANLLAAHLALKASDSEAAKKRLLACPLELRGLEWRMLFRMASSEVAVLRGAHPRFSPDGSHLFTVVDKRDLLQWDTRSFQATSIEAAKTILGGRGDGSEVSAWSIFATSQDASRLLVGRAELKPGASGSIGDSFTVFDVFDVATGTVTDLGVFREIRVGPANWYIPQWTFSKDGRSVACWYVEDASLVFVFDVQSGRRRAKIRVHGDTQVTVVAFSPSQDQLLIGQSDGDVSVWDLRTQQVTQVWALPNGVGTDGVSAMDHEGLVTAVGYWSGEIKVRDAASGKVLRAWRGHEAGIEAVDVSPDGQTVLSAAADGTVKLWRRSESSAVASWIAGNLVEEVSLSPDGSLVAVSEPNETRIWRTRTGSGSLGSSVNAVSVSPDGRSIACGLFDRDLVILDMTSREPIAHYRIETHASRPGAVSRSGRWATTGDHVPLYAVRFASDGARILSGDAEGVLRIHDAHTAKVLRTVATGNAAILALDVSPDGRWGAIGLQDGVVQLHDLAERSGAQRLYRHSGEVLAVTFSPDGKTLAWGGAKGVALWDMATRRIRWSIDTPEGVNSLSFDREGRRLVGGFKNQSLFEDRSHQGYAEVWNAMTGQKLADLNSGRAGEEINSVSFSPDGRRIVAGSSSGRVHVFSTDPFELLLSFDEESSVEALAFTATGDRLICGLWNGDVAVWDIGDDSDQDGSSR